ncbi:MAG TPA: hypothetical protein EYG72_00485 [Candidatus Pacebacteria bacterium]|nr:hypothetical protein [Candidatus Peregrinibacteria bacterium]HIP21434.1 hypothetical protein [Candidatus Paceibacterota bacterium]
MKILEYKRIFLSIATMMILGSFAMITFFGFNLGVDFSGGTVYEIKYTQDKSPLISDIKKAVSDAGIGTSSVQKLGETSFVIKTPELSDENKNILDDKLSVEGKYVFEEVQLKTISPSVSSEFANKSI